MDKQYWGEFFIGMAMIILLAVAMYYTFDLLIRILVFYTARVGEPI